MVWAITALVTAIFAFVLLGVEAKMRWALSDRFDAHLRKRAQEENDPYTFIYTCEECGAAYDYKFVQTVKVRETWRFPVEDREIYFCPNHTVTYDLVVRSMAKGYEYYKTQLDVTDEVRKWKDARLVEGTLTTPANSCSCSSTEKESAESPSVATASTAP